MATIPKLITPRQMERGIGATPRLLSFSPRGLPRERSLSCQAPVRTTRVGRQRAHRSLETRPLGALPCWRTRLTSGGGDGRDDEVQIFRADHTHLRAEGDVRLRRRNDRHRVPGTVGQRDLAELAGTDRCDDARVPSDIRRERVALRRAVQQVVGPVDRDGGPDRGENDSQQDRQPGPTTERAAEASPRSRSASSRRAWRSAAAVELRRDQRADPESDQEYAKDLGEQHVADPQRDERLPTRPRAARRPARENDEDDPDDDHEAVDRRIEGAWLHQRESFSST